MLEYEPRHWKFDLVKPAVVDDKSILPVLKEVSLKQTSRTGDCKEILAEIDLLAFRYPIIHWRC